jgi:cell division protein FtsQ
MWDRPDILNSAANALFAAAIVMVVYTLIHLTVRLPVFPLREVRMNNAFLHVTQEQVEAIVRGEISGNFFTVNLPRVRAAFERLPWVRNVDLRRQWPDRLEVALEEHVPLARWGGEALVNTHGEVFTAAFDGRLLTFVAARESLKEITIQYEFFRRNLAAVGLAPVQIQVSPRRAWQVRADNGMTIDLGREDIEPRLERFIGAYPRTIGRLQRRIDHVDLRYPNGFAVRIPELRGELRDNTGGRAVRNTATPEKKQ